MPSPSLPRYRPQVFVWLGLLLAALAVALGWWVEGRPVALPDAPSARISCVSYAPFRDAGETPLDPNAFISPQRIDADLQVLSQRFDCVRTYSQGQGLSAVPRIAARHGMKVLMGIWLGADPKANEEQVRLGIAAAKETPQALRGVIVGNEVLLRGELSASALAGYVRQVRDAVDAPVTYADVWEFWLRYPQLAASVDYITIHILPYWEDKPVAPERAVQHVAEVYARVQQAFPGRRVMIGETGWPSAGRPRQRAAASVINEARYLREFLRYAAKVDLPYNVIEAFDQPWKRAQEGTVGGYWGIFDAQAKAKFPMQGPVVEEPRWWIGEAAAGAGALLFVLVGGWRRRWRGRLALMLAGWASGGALAWQARQMAYACRDAWEWSISTIACLCALGTALWLARWIAARLDGEQRAELPMLPVRFGWLFVLAFYGLLLVFDGRYRDFPLGLFALPCVGFALAAWLSPRAVSAPLLEARFLAVALLLLGSIVLVQERGLNPASWLWLGLNLLLAVPVLLGWWRAARRRGLPTQQA
ncbi:glycoside hydrolase family 17 [Rhodanobacter sp. Root480]|uniref:glycoside hydrolase family 17 protein n=1 Tax=Rhodanobacter sp. Root480 TaxID=1736542 RepID=UPI000701ACC0|nr:hypothetical protein [Rhodanobacter sp. Root480]KQX96324.1 glycoside hydrolase family 17 [Rhodanobacter sp. Root480]